MTVGVGDLLQIVDEGEYVGQKCLNVFYYRVINTAAFVGVGLQIAAENYRDQVLPAIRAIQVSGYLHTKIAVKDLTSGVDFYDLVGNWAGINVTPTGDSAPSYVSLGFQLLRSTLATRNGYKRLAGLPEAWISGNQWIGAAPAITALELAFADSLNDGINVYAEPVIVKRPVAVPAAIPYAYSVVRAAQIKRLGTQNTRKP